MKKMLGWLLLAGLLWAQGARADNEAVWAKSYQLEAAQRYADSLAVLDEMKPSGLDAELMMLRRGWLNYLAGNFSDSVSWYKQALGRNSRSVEAALGATLPLLAQQRWREAALYARRALELAPNDYTAYLRLIVAEEGIRDWPSVKKHAETLSEHYPGDASALVYLARAQVGLGNVAEARRSYLNVLSRVPGHLEASGYVKVNGM